MRNLLFGLILMTGSTLSAATYYAQVTGTQDMTVLSKWNTNPGGGGSAPSNFTTYGDNFVIQSSQTILLSASISFGAGVNLEIKGTLNPTTYNLSVGGNTLLSGAGSFIDGSGTGVNTFVGSVTLNTTGSWQSTSTTVATNMVFSSGITNQAGTFSGGACTIATIITPTAAMSFAGNIICTGDLTIANGQLVTNSGGVSNISGDFTVGTGGFTKSSGSLTVGGKITTTGPWTSTGSTMLINGNITNNASATFVCGNITFSPTASNLNLNGTGPYNFTGNAVIASSKSVTNNCSHTSGIAITGILNGSNSSSTWINASGKLLNYTSSGAVNAPMITGVLNATASGNIVCYNKSGGSQNVKSTTYANLKIDGGGAKIALGPVTITENLDLVNGTLNTTTGNFALLQNGATTNVGSSSAYVNGPMRYDMAYNGTRTLKFPVGKGTDWRPMEVVITHSTSTSYTYRAEVFNASAQALGYTLPSTVDKVSQAHYWDIGRFITGTNTRESSVDLSGNQVITIYYGANDNVQDSANLTIVKNNWTTLTEWFDIGGTGATYWTGKVTSTSSPSVFNSFSKFTLANKKGGNNPLPVKLISFTGACDNNQVSLNWATATEINNDFFTVESSIDGKNWQSEGTVKGNGNSSEIIKYSYTLPMLYQSGGYFRLKQTDYDGTTDYSGVIMVKKCASDHDPLVLYPNPANDVLNIRVTTEWVSDSRIEIHDLAGNIVLDTVWTQGIDISALPAGLYYLHLNTGLEKWVRRFTITR